MRTRPLSVLAVVACASAASLVRADAPGEQYEPFRGVDVIIIDRQTGLVWDRRPLSDPTGGAPLTPNLTEAQSKCAALAPARFSRLPTMKELLTLVDEDPRAVQQGAKIIRPTLDLAAFPDTPVDLPYWTATDSKEGGAMVVDFLDGRTSARRASERVYARCVYNSK